MDFFNLPSTTLTELSAALIVVNIAAAFGLSLVIIWVYQKTHRGLAYSQSFVVSMIMMTILATIAMMILSNNLVRALGVLGIFALIRFRTIIKETRDIAFLFFVLAMGMAVGTNNYLIAAIGTAALSLIVLLLYRYNFGSLIREGFLLTFIADQHFVGGSQQPVFNQFLASAVLLQIRTQADGDREYYYSVRFKDGGDHGRFVDSLRALPGVKITEVVTGRDAHEY